MKTLPRQGSVGLSALDAVDQSASTSVTPATRTTAFDPNAARVAMYLQNPPTSGAVITLHTDDVDVIAVLSAGMSWGLSALEGGLIEDKEIFISANIASVAYIAVEYNAPAV
jgi:hypothetical protein